MFRHFVFTTEKTQPRPQVFSINCLITWQLCYTIDVISSHIFFQIWSTVAGYDEFRVGFWPIRDGEIFWMNNSILYYIDTSVLLENIPLVKFIKTTSGTRVVYFPQSHTWVYRWHNFGNFPPLCLYNKKNITRGLEDMNFIFSWQKQYFTHSLRSFVKYCFATRK